MGPTPEVKYKANLSPNPNRVAKFDQKSSSLVSANGGGIEQIPQSVYSDGKKYEFMQQIWGTWRARLDPYPETNTYGRSNFHFHNSTKGFSSGCIEVSSELFNVLIENRNASKKYIDVVVDYPTNNSST